ncbi:MAG: M48 family metallopeptidase [Cytophagales bacterium]|nr:M48 family metallopeptidase [Cytophagales bacterium]
MNYKIKYGTSVIRYSISRSDRKTLAIEVHPDLSIKVVAPRKAAISAIQEKILKRGQWIKKQQHYFEQFLPRTPKREYVSGETHYYLGKQYILRIRKSSDESVKLKGGELIVKVERTNDVKQIKQILSSWYYQHALKKFDESISTSLQRFKEYDLNRPKLELRRMARRWGSCTPNKMIILIPEIIKAPSKCIDYVVIHELCHLVHPNHSQSFYELQNKVMPDNANWKLRLEKLLA